MSFKKINKVIKILIYSDVLFVGGFGFIAPIFAIFLTENIKGGNVETVGFAAAILWIIQSLVMIPFGRFLDHHEKDLDDFYFVVVGNFLSAIVAFSYILVKTPIQIYFLQAVYAVGSAMNMAGYTALFTRYINKGKEVFSWSVRGSLVGIGSGLAGALGGIIYKNFGSKVLFSGVGFLVLLSSIIMFFVFKEIIFTDGKKIKSILPKTKSDGPLTPGL